MLLDNWLHVLLHKGLFCPSHEEKVTRQWPPRRDGTEPSRCGTEPSEKSQGESDFLQPLAAGLVQLDAETHGDHKISSLSKNPDEADFPETMRTRDRHGGHCSKASKTPGPVEIVASPSRLIQNISLDVLKNIWEVARSTCTYVREAIRRAAIPFLAPRFHFFMMIVNWNPVLRDMWDEKGSAG